MDKKLKEALWAVFWTTVIGIVFGFSLIAGASLAQHLLHLFLSK